LLVAAGGGGGGDSDFEEHKCPGGAGGAAEEKGANGTNCGSSPGEGGGAGEATKGGKGGAGFLAELPYSGCDGKAGQLGAGGEGNNLGLEDNGGGGGGGRYGGGGGGCQGQFSGQSTAGDGGGGGGSNLVPAGGTFVGTAKAGEAGSVTVSYMLPPQTCGKTTIGKVTDPLVANLKRVNKCVVPFNAAVTQLTTYLSPTSFKGQELIKGIIYADNKGKPGALVGVTEQITFKSTEAAGWYPLKFASPVKVAAGTYWIGVITGNSGKVAAERYDAVKNAEDYNTNIYTSGPSNPFGSFKTTNEEMSLYATFTACPVGPFAVVCPA
jgi:hypothetical protein